MLFLVVYVQLVASYSAIFQLCSDGAYMKILTDQTPMPLAVKNAVYPHTGHVQKMSYENNLLLKNLSNTYSWFTLSGIRTDTFQSRVLHATTLTSRLLEYMVHITCTKSNTTTAKPKGSRPVSWTGDIKWCPRVYEKLHFYITTGLNQYEYGLQRTTVD